MSNTAIVDHAILSDRHSTAFVGEQGTFLLCTFWLTEALALADQVDPAMCLSGPLRSQAISGCSRRRSTQRPVSYLATSPRHLAKSASLTPRERSPKPSTIPLSQWRHSDCSQHYGHAVAEGGPAGGPTSCSIPNSPGSARRAASATRDRGPCGRHVLRARPH